MIKNKVLKFLLLALAIISFGAFAEERVLEDSLVYDDPTVSRPGKWSAGLSLDYFATKNDTTVNDTQGGSHSASQTLYQPGGSMFIGYGDFSLMGSYRQGTVNTNVPAGGGLTSSNTGNETYKNTEIDVRWLATPLAMKYFVPYALVGWEKVNASQKWNVYVNGVQEDNVTNAQGFGAGLGGIVPLTEKFGFRIDARNFWVQAKTTSNLFAAFNSTKNTNDTQFTATAYYNITDGANIQLGLKTSSYTNTGVYAQLGYTFR